MSGSPFIVKRTYCILSRNTLVNNRIGVSTNHSVNSVISTVLLTHLIVRKLREVFT